MKRICVYCGSNPGHDPRIRAAAQQLGQTLARSNLALVYGGARVGVMGVLADATLAAGGEVIGVIPRSLVTREVAHQGLTEQYIVYSMHERKALMAALADGFVALPGGLGTLEELFEMWTWAQLAFHDKPVGLLNVAGYYDSLLTFLDEMVRAGFVQRPHRDLLRVGTAAAPLLAQLGAVPAATEPDSAMSIGPAAGWPA